VDDTTQVIELVKQQAGTTRVFTFGLGSDVSIELVNGLAREGRGTAGTPLIVPW